MADQSFLVIVDADKIHEYVFAPEQLKLIRGGSAIQAELNQRVLLQELLELGLGDCNVDPTAGRILDSPTLESDPLLPWEAVYAGGGTVLVRFRDGEQAAAYAVRAENSFIKRTAAAASASSIRVVENDDFQQAYVNVRRRLEAVKAARVGHHSSAATPYWKTCDSCGRYPAARRQIHPEGERYPCAACVKRLQNAESGPFLADVCQEAKKGISPPRDFEQLAERSRPEGWLALVYIDINRLGRFLVERACASPATFREHSRAIHDAVHNGVVRACAGLSVGLPDGELAPFEILLLGGDDAIVVLGAQHVFGFIKSFKTVFDAEPLMKDLDFSSAVVWAHQHFPIAQSLSLAEQLLRSAKRRPGGGFAVDFLVVTESLAGDVGPRETPHTRKPYALEDFFRMAESIAGWKRADVPSTKIKGLFNIAHLSRNQALLDYFFLLSRLDKTHRDLLQGLFPGGALWDADGRTSAADLVELWDFVEVR